MIRKNHIFLIIKLHNLGNFDSRCFACLHNQCVLSLDEEQRDDDETMGSVGKSSHWHWFLVEKKSTLNSDRLDR